MIPVLYEKTARTFQNNGLGGLPHALSCTVTREANTPGGYYLDMEYPVDGLHYGDIQEERLIYSAPAPGRAPQPFRISRIEPEGKTAHIFAPHVSAQLQKITTYGAFTAQSFTGVTYDFAQVARAAGQDFPFWFSSDLSFDTQKKIDFSTPTDFMSVLLGAKGSILDHYGGEYEFDGWHVILHQQAGQDTGIEIRSGANIISVRASTDDSGLVNAVVPYFKGSQDGQDVFVYGALCKAPTADNYHILRSVPLDVSGDFSDLEEGTLPTAAQVTAQGQAFINSTDSSVLRTSYEIEYIPTPPQLSTMTPAPARHLDLFDWADAVLPEYGLQGKAKAVKTVHNVLLDRYNSVTIGTLQRNAADTVAALIRSTGNQKILW